MIVKLELDEARRLTGPNLLWDKPGAIVDVLIEGVDPQLVAQKWQKWVTRCQAEFGWHNEQSTYRVYAEGANLAISAPMDALYVACELAELAWHCCAAEIQRLHPPEWRERLAELRIDLAEESNPRLLHLLAAADKHTVPCLCDDDELSLGMGASTQVWIVGDLPLPHEVGWVGFHDVPCAYVTGTNGKSTSVRLAAEIAKAARINAGITSTDFIRVGDVIIDRGDYSGPGGARIVLRDHRTEMAFLEVARGGILRRGLPVNRVNAALITNVASDHLGQYGINTVEALAETKFVVAKALHDDGVLVVNADNDLVVEQAAKLDKTLCWFSLDEDNVLIQQQLSVGGRAVFVRGGHLIYVNQSREQDFGALKDMPMSFDGKALYNIQNALGVVGLCSALNLPEAAIRAGLSSFGSNAVDNPGRGNRYQVNGVEVVLDFAHNEHSMRAVIQMVADLPASNKIVMFGHAGDRSDEEIQALANAVAELDASCYIVSELEPYLRGRELGDIPKVVKQALLDRKIPALDFRVSDNPLAGAKLAMQTATKGDLVLLFVLDQREQVHDYLVSLK